MNIAFILSYWQDRFGGPVRIVKEQGRVLADMGHNVSYWAPDEGDAPDDAVAVDNLHRCRCDRPRSWRRSRDLVRRLSRSAHRFDVIDISELWTHPPYAAGRIAAARGVPYVIRPAGGLERWSLQRGYLRSLKKRAYLKCILKPVIDRAACLQAASTKEVDSLRRSGYQGPVAVIPGAVDTEALCPVDSSESHEYWPELKDRAVVLFMSRLSPEKGLNILIPLWADLVRSPSYRDTLLILAGPDYRGYGKRSKP